MDQGEKRVNGELIYGRASADTILILKEKD